MLTATYSIIAISNEQKNARTLLCRLKNYIHDCLEKCQEIDFTKFQSALDTLAQFDRYCHARKVETVLIPTVRGTDQTLDGLLSELESISASAMELLRAAQEKMGQAIEHGCGRVNELFGAMEHYCDNLLKRLAKEEEELLPMVMRVLPIEKWFEIAAKFLSEDTQQKRRRERRALQLQALA